MPGPTEFWDMMNIFKNIIFLMFFVWGTITAKTYIEYLLHVKSVYNSDGHWPLPFYRHQIGSRDKVVSKSGSNISFNCNVFPHTTSHASLPATTLLKERKGSLCPFTAWPCGHNSFWVFFLFRERMSSDFKVRGQLHKQEMQLYSAAFIVSLA